MTKINGCTTYILHGWTFDIYKWQPLIQALEEKGLKVKLLKIPGLTQSLKTPWHLDDYYNWFLKEVGKETHINLIAHSFGGRIAIRFDIKNPNVIKKLVLIDSAGIRPGSLTAIIKRVSFKAIAKIGRKITSNKQARKLLYKLVGEKDYFLADKILAETMANIVKEDQKDELQFVKAHTLIVWGSGDKVTPLADGRLMHKTITGSSLKIVDGAKHSPQYTHPKEVSSYIFSFIAT